MDNDKTTMMTNGDDRRLRSHLIISCNLYARTQTNEQNLETRKFRILSEREYQQLFFYVRSFIIASRKELLSFAFTNNSFIHLLLFAII